MTEFTKAKIGFALALLGTLFALHPFVEKYGERGFRFSTLEERFTVLHVFALMAGLLAFAVYCYGLALLYERPGSFLERLGNYSYALALMVVPLYALLFGSNEIAERFNQTHLAWVAPAAAVGAGVIWLGLAWWLRRRLGEQDQSALLDRLSEQEIGALNRSREMFASNHFDLSVIEAWKAIEARLRRVLLQRGVRGNLDNPQVMIDTAARAGVVREPALGLLQELRRQWNIAVSVEPITREAADAALSAARHILATIPVAQTKPRPSPVI